MQVEKDEEYIKSVTALGAVIEDLVKANNAVDIYEEYFAGKVISCCHALTLMHKLHPAVTCERSSLVQRRLKSAFGSESSQCRLCMTLQSQHGKT